MYTNKGLVKHAKMALSLKTIYMWGGILRLVEKQYNTLFQIYGNKQGTGYTPQRWSKLKNLCYKDTYGVDCVGLIKSYLWSGQENGGVGSPNYGIDCPDIPAGDMYEKAKEKGTVRNLQGVIQIPEIEGLILYCKTYPHVGIYIGNGKVIESTLSARGDGVVKTDIKDFVWEYWFKCPYITYSEKINKSIEQVAREVIQGLWGAGDERKRKLTDAGYSYQKVQDMVNKMLKG